MLPLCAAAFDEVATAAYRSVRPQKAKTENSYQARCQQGFVSHKIGGRVNLSPANLSTFT